MTANEKLIYFMQRKAEFINRFTGLPDVMYFNTKDVRDIREWPEAAAQGVWLHILETHIKMNSSEKYLSGRGLDLNFHPFCVKNNCFCWDCFYAGNHKGECPYDPSSDLWKITRALQGKKKAFTKIIYTKIIEEIVNWEKV